MSQVVPKLAPKAVFSFVPLTQPRTRTQTLKLSPMKTLNLDYKAKHAIVQIDHGKVNAIDTDLARELGEVFRDLATNDAVKGVILTGKPHCFSAGLNIVHLAQIGLEGARNFWLHMLGTLQTLVRFPKPLVAAISGYAPAGATILALTADYRVMGQGEKHKIGMNEFNTSMLIPELLADVYAYTLGEPRAWELVQKASLFTSDEAKAIGLVHESVAVEEVLERAEKHLKKLLRIHPPVFAKSKAYLRKDLLKRIDRDMDEMLDEIENNLKDPFVEQSMKMFLAALKSKEERDKK